MVPEAEQGVTEAPSALAVFRHWQMIANIENTTRFTISWHWAHIQSASFMRCCQLDYLWIKLLFSWHPGQILPCLVGIPHLSVTPPAEIPWHSHLLLTLKLFLACPDIVCSGLFYAVNYIKSVISFNFEVMLIRHLKISLWALMFICNFLVPMLSTSG